MVLGRGFQGGDAGSPHSPHESGFSLRVIRRKTWGKKSQRKKVSGQRRSGRVNAMGGVRYSDKKRFVEFIKKEIQKLFMKW
jgi:hypothetical protein